MKCLVCWPRLLEGERWEDERQQRSGEKACGYIYGSEHTQSVLIFSLHVNAYQRVFAAEKALNYQVNRIIVQRLSASLYPLCGFTIPQWPLIDVAMEAGKTAACRRIRMGLSHPSWLSCRCFWTPICWLQRIMMSPPCGTPYEGVQLATWWQGDYTGPLH